MEVEGRAAAADAHADEQPAPARTLARALTDTVEEALLLLLALLAVPCAVVVFLPLALISSASLRSSKLCTPCTRFNAALLRTKYERGEGHGAGHDDDDDDEQEETAAEDTLTDVAAASVAAAAAAAVISICMTLSILSTMVGAAT